jgi:magnesium transporter
VEAGKRIYEFPANCKVRTEPVSRWALGIVIAIAVMGICLWGTLIGCLIPLVISKLGGDPALASGAFVATIVDVTGIIIFFGSAWLILL